MLRIIQNTSAAGVKKYYSASDYYTEGQELQGIWHGECAKRLGLSGVVQKEPWDALCDNRHPETGKTLTPRRKETRRTGYDFNFHVPKSVSLLYGLTQDERILQAFRASVDETMHDIQAEVKTRVRKGGKNEDRVSGNLVWGTFVHSTARPIKGIPDPHLHAHCFVFNVTFDAEENRFKAAQFGDVKRDGSLYEAKFHSRMARRIAELGVPIERTRKGWEIAGISKATLNKFSRRTVYIEEAAREKGISDPIQKSELGAKTRERKQKKISINELRREWQSRLTSDEQSGVLRVVESIGGPSIPENMAKAKEAVVLATDHCFERKSVVDERELLAQALKWSVGLAPANAIEQAVRDQDLITAERDGRRLVTTSEVLGEEQRMTDFARRGRGTCAKLGSGAHEFQEPKLNDGQRRAVLHVLNSPDRVILIRGAAGVGKTTAMREAVTAIEANGKQVFTFAPSADASRGVLRDQEGFRDADTVARLLVDEKLQEKIHGNVLWIDEAGLLGARVMVQVFDLAQKMDARIVLSGDRRQHGSVERGSALRLLETEAGLVPAEIKNIQRQKGAYKQAVEALSEGRIQDGFQRLDELGWVREVSQGDRYKILAADYVAAIKAGKSALVISPTHREGEKITDEIRLELRNIGQLSKQQRQVQALEKSDLTLAQRKVVVNYHPGDVLLFHQNAKGYTKGQRIVVGEAPLPLDQADKYQVYHPQTLPISPGETIRITRNGKTAGGEHRVNNGAIYSVKGFKENGDLLLTNGWTLSQSFGGVAHGYVVTSYASQGKTVDRVFIGQSSDSNPAASREQFYVSVSRGKEQATVYTSDKRALLEAVNQTSDRMTATEMISTRDLRERCIVIQRMDVRSERSREAKRQHEVNYER